MSTFCANYWKKSKLERDNEVAHVRWLLFKFLMWLSRKERRGCHHTASREREGLASVSESVDCIQPLFYTTRQGRVTRLFTKAPWDVSQAPYTERSLQVKLANRAFALMPICACSQSKRRGVLQRAKQFLPLRESALACGLVLPLLSHGRLDFH